MKLVNNRYKIDGIDILKICNKYGNPLYVYDFNKFESQYKKLKSAFKNIKNLNLNFACKSLTNTNVLKFFNKLGMGLDAVSIQEVQIGIKAGFNIDDILFTPNNISMEEMEEAMELGVKINIDNISTLEKIGNKYPKTDIFIRINPMIFGGGNSKISVGHIDSKFGISYYQLPLIKRIVDKTTLNVKGIHMHTGSDILDIDTFIKGANILFEIAKNFENIECINLGSGFKVAYSDSDYSTDINMLGDKLSNEFNKLCKEINKDLTLIFEPGKFMVSEGGYFFTKVNVIKNTPSNIFACVDSGFNHLIRPMFYDAFHDIINISNPKGIDRIYTVTGYICESDTFGINRRIKEIKENDILCIKNAGAYCFSMSSNYNSRYRPAEIMINKNKEHIIRKRETIDDLLKNEILLEDELI